MKDIQIHPTNDFHELAKLNESVQNWHHTNYPAEFKPFDYNATVVALQQILAKPESVAYIAKYNQHSVGYLIGWVTKRPESAFQYEKTVFHIDQIAVDSDYQKHGIGTLLMDEALNYARTKNSSEIQLDHWSLNKKAESFFQKNGFVHFNHKMKKQF